MEEVVQLGLLDSLVLTFSLLISFIIGAWISMKNWMKNGNVEMDYALANRRLPFIPVAVSIATSVMPVVLLLGVPAEIYTKGSQIALFGCGGLLSAIFAAVFFVKIFYPMKVTSVHEYIQLRYHSRALRVITALLFIFTQFISTTGILYCACVSVGFISSFPGWALVLAIIVCSLSSLILGGIKSVVWTNFFHFILIIGALATICVLILLKTSVTIESVWEQLNLYERHKMWNIDPDPSRSSVWSVVVMFGFHWLALFTAAPSVQQSVSVRTRRRSQIGMVVAGFLFFILAAAIGFVGMVVIAAVTTGGCDPLRARRLSTPLQLLPWVALRVLSYPGVAGLVVAAIACSTLSGVVSCHLSLACCVWEDILKPKYFHASEDTKSLIIKLSAVISTLLSTGCALFLALSQDPFPLFEEFLSYTGVLLGPMLGVLLLGAIVPYAGPWAAIIGMAMAGGGTLWMAIQRTNAVIITGNYAMMHQSQSLPPFPTHNCVNSSYTSQFTSSEPPTASYTTNIMSSSLLPWPHDEIFLSFAFLGSLGTVIIGALFGLFPCWRMSSIDPDCLFPCIRWLRNKSACCPQLDEYEDLPNSLNSSAMFQDTSHIIHKEIFLDLEKSPSLSMRERLLTVQSETVL